jgi:hypothetical protein
MGYALIGVRIHSFIHDIIAHETPLQQTVKNPPKPPNCPQGPRRTGCPRPEKCELSPSKRSEIVQARVRDGLSWTEVQEKTKEAGKPIPMRTLRNTVANRFSHTSGISKPRSGRPKKIIEEEKK